MNVPEPKTSAAMQRVLAVLRRHGNMAAADIAAEAFVGVTTLACGGYIRALKARGLIYISGWRKVGGRFSTPLYSGGNLPDIARPRIDETNRDAPGMRRIVATLARFGALDYRQIAELSGLSVNTLKNSGFLDALIVQQRIHVAAWKRSPKGPMSPVYRLGADAAAPRPDPLNAAEKSRRQRQRAQADRGSWRSQIAALAAAIDG